ncbi:MAG: hypothetical protein IJ659_07885 [Alloprevotella sp.]|nr:hypothetical protein [Alloprevotella sp.]
MKKPRTWDEETTAVVYGRDAVRGRICGLCAACPRTFLRAEHALFADFLCLLCAKNLNFAPK